MRQFISLTSNSISLTGWFRPSDTTPARIRSFDPLLDGNGTGNCNVCLLFLLVHGPHPVVSHSSGISSLLSTPRLPDKLQIVYLIDSRLL